MTTTVHVVEPGGRGGVHQHAAALVAALAESGVSVVFHSAADAEVPGDRHSCLWRFPRLRPRPVRRAALATAWLGVGVPTCLARVRPGHVVQIEGWFRPGLLLPLFVGARLRGARVVLSPHNSFSRRGRPLEEALMRWMARRAHLVLTFSDHDRSRIQGWGAKAAKVAMVLRPPPPDQDLVAWWRRRWDATAGRKVVLLAGQLRPDKGLHVLVRAASIWGRDGPALAIVGEDLGALAPARALAGQLAVELACDGGYQPLHRFVAAVAAADVIACPYRVASQSSVLVLAAALGRPTVATDVGGLPELATIVVPVDDPVALAQAVAKALDSQPAPPPRRQDVVAAYLESYGLVADAGERVLRDVVSPPARM